MQRRKSNSVRRRHDSVSETLVAFPNTLFTAQETLETHDSFIESCDFETLQAKRRKHTETDDVSYRTNVVTDEAWKVLWPSSRTEYYDLQLVETANVSDLLYFCGNQRLVGTFWRRKIEDHSEKSSDWLAFRFWNDNIALRDEQALVSIGFAIRDSETETPVVAIGDVIVPLQVTKALNYLVSNKLLYGKVSNHPCVIEECTENIELDITFYFSEKMFLNSPTSPCEYKNRQLFRFTNTLISWLHPEFSVYSGFEGAKTSKTVLDSTWFEQLLEKFHSEENALRQKKYMETRLNICPRPYQLRAIAWMLYRESALKQNLGYNNNGNPLWFPIWNPKFPSSPSFYYNPCTGQISKYHFDNFPDIFGGILADEMGLGKTLEVLSLIVLTLPKRENRVHQEKTARVFWGRMFSDENNENISLYTKHRAERNIDSENEDLYSMITEIESVEECSSCNACCLDNDDTPQRFRSLFVRCDECGKVEHAWCANYRFDRAIKVLQSTPHLCYECESDYQSRKLLTSRATLIVCPSTILRQWEEEISRSTKQSNLQVLIYQGIKENSYTPAKKMAEMDIVLTTYDALRSDLNRADVGNGPCLRYAKVFRAVPTPLCRIQWYRICLDEAQVVEGGSHGAADMAQVLSSYRRWCVEPFQDYFWWNRFVWKPAQMGMDTHLKDLIRRLVWRNTKNMVKEELHLPPLSMTTVKLSFGPIERHFYERQYEFCASEVSKVLGKNESSGTLQDWNTEPHFPDLVSSKKFLFRLLRLRQACCHPQVGSDGIRVLQKSSMTMQQVLEALVQRRTVEVAEAQRSFITSLNGLAALKILEDDLVEAVNLYRSVLQTAKTHEEYVTMDPLQRLHVLCNLDDIFERIENNTREIQQVPKNRRTEKQENNLIRLRGIGKMLIESIYKEEIKQIEAEYTADKVAKVAKAKNQYDCCKSHCEEIVGQRSKVPWWMEALDELVVGNYKLEEQIMEQIRSQLLYDSQKLFAETSLASRFHNIDGLRYVLLTELDKRDKYRMELLQTLESLPGARTPTCEEVLTSGNCRQCRIEGNGPLCQHCQAKSKFLAYERSLFLVRMKNIGKETEGGRFGVISEGDEGARLQSEVEKMLRIIKACIRRHHRKKLSYIDDMERHFQEVEALKEEFKACHQFFEAQHDLLSALDELEMSKMRISFRIAGEGQKRKNDHIYLISKDEIPILSMQFEQDRMVAQTELQRKKSQLIYLKLLKSDQETQSQEQSKDKTEKVSCPVCWRQLGTQIVILPCGHRFCVECMSHIIQQKVSEEQDIQRKSDHERFVSCPTCRVKVCLSELCYIAQSDSDQICILDIERTTPEVTGINEENLFITKEYAKEMWHTMQGEVVRDSFGTKISGIVIFLKMITERHPNCKCLLFSEWNDVLEIMSQALQHVNITFIRTQGNRGKKFDEAIQKFRRDSNIRVLLLPVRSGSNGLNLTEATHVFLIEPLLSDSTEAQAIGRIHRIGQTQRTFVYRFWIENTIEERIEELRRRRKVVASDMCAEQKPILGKFSKHGMEEENLTFYDLQMLFSDDKGP
eukprot:jgi/Galph1/4428/GphlegSOOS_G3051.1